MATANYNDPDFGKDNFVLELKRVRDEVKQKFEELIDCINTRERQLLDELEMIEACYHSYQAEAEKQKVTKRDLEKMKQSLSQELTSSSVKSKQEKFLIEIGQDIGAMDCQTLTEPKLVRFVCDTEMVIQGIRMLGQLVEIDRRRGIDYENKVYPVVSVGETGYEREQLNWPWGMAVENATARMYIANQWNDCVSVFDSFGNFLFKFGDCDGVGKMEYPKGLTICGDRILITQGHISSSQRHNILNYQLNGEFVSRIGKYGRNENEYSSPFGLTFDESSGYIFICDSGNDRIQILSKEFNFISQFGAGKLLSPRDIKLSLECIVVLDKSTPCIHLFDYNYNLERSVLSKGEGMDLMNPFCFSIDKSDNIIFSDKDANSILIFNPILTTKTGPLDQFW